MDPNEREFLLELTKLSRKYKICIDGCGCCGSPYIQKLSNEALEGINGYAREKDSDSIGWVTDKDDNEYEKISIHNLVR